MISATFVTGRTIGLMTVAVVDSLFCVSVNGSLRALLAKFSPMSKFLAKANTIADSVVDISSG